MSFEYRGKRTDDTDILLTERNDPSPISLSKWLNELKLYCNNLTSLIIEDVNFNRFNDDSKLAADEFAPLIGLPQLKTLSLENNNLGKAGVLALINLLNHEMSGLEVLRLARNGPTSEGFNEVWRGLVNFISNKDGAMQTITELSTDFLRNETDENVNQSNLRLLSEAWSIDTKLTSLRIMVHQSGSVNEESVMSSIQDVMYEEMSLHAGDVYNKKMLLAITHGAEQLRA